MIVLAAGAFLTFVGFLFAGLLALAITAALDKSLGKEKTLLLYTGLLLVFTLAMCQPEISSLRGKPRPDSEVPAAQVDVAGDPFARPDFVQDPYARNPFQKHSDTRALPPVVLDDPPWPALETSLPPTVPGPGPDVRHLLRGPLPDAKPGDGSSIADVPEATFADYTPVAADVYDAVVKGGRKSYIYIRAIREGNQWYQEGDPRYDALKWALVRKTTGWEQLEVEGALVGPEEVASKNLEPAQVATKSRQNRSTVSADQFDEWVLRATVDNLYREVLRRHGLERDLEASTDIGSLMAAAADMAEIGQTGKENKEGWRRAAALLELALVQARAHGVAEKRAEVLQRLVDAYVALRDEDAVLRVLAAYARVSPTRPEPWVKLGLVYLRRLGLAEEALAYFEAALARSPRQVEALLGMGDALTTLGRHAAALEVYRKAPSSADAKVRVAEAELRLGNLEAASAAAQAALAFEDTPRARIVQGAVSYAQSDLGGARSAFERAALAPGAEGLEYRAEALYDLGLTAWRLGEADAALAAFEASDRALQFGASAGRSADEAVAPAFGRALVALSAGNASEFRTAMAEAKEQAPGAAYPEALAGMLASRDGNDAVAVRAFDRALRLTGVYPELDGWIAKTRLNLGLQALAAGTPVEEATPDFEAAVAFSARASQTALARDKKAFRDQLRETWIRIHALQEPVRKRYEKAMEVADRILKRIDREQPAALTLRGYCNYHLAGLGALAGTTEDPYATCIRDLQQVLDKVAVDDEGEWRPWRDYAGSALTAIKHWRSLEEKTISFDGSALPSDWKVDESFGVRHRIEDGVVVIAGNATQDGTYSEPTFELTSGSLVTVGSFEDVRLLARIPSRTTAGTARNTVTFGLQIQKSGGSRGGIAKQAGIGVFYDRGKVAVRIGGGREDRWKDGLLHRLVPEMDWPDAEWVEFRIVREDEDEGLIAVYLDATPGDGVEGVKIAEDVVGTFKGSSRTKAEIWIGGYSTQAQTWDIEVKDIRIVRRK